jgi:CRP-like cAMP-binding protein
MVSGHASMPVSGGRTQTTAPVVEHSGRGGVVLLSFPTDDTLFQRLADRQVRAVREGATQLRAARRHLRTRYPKADLNRQKAVIVRGRQIEFWFAHRDGHREPSIPDNSWWHQRGTARAIVQSGGRLTDPNRACQSLLRMPRSAGRLALARDFLPTDLCDELTAGATWLPREILLLAEMEHSLPLVPVTEQQLADGVGSLRESVARAIAGLRRRGWLATTRYGIIVLDAVALRRAANPDSGAGHDPEGDVAETALAHRGPARALR